MLSCLGKLCPTVWEILATNHVRPPTFSIKLSNDHPKGTFIDPKTIEITSFLLILSESSLFIGFVFIQMLWRSEGYTT